jgi:hypothetical protein
VVMPSKKLVCGSLIARFVGSNPVEIMDIRLLCLLCVVQVADSAMG